MATFHERFLKCVKISSVHPTDFANSKQSLLPTSGQTSTASTARGQARTIKYQAISASTTSDNDFYDSLCDWKNLNKNFLLETVISKVAIRV